MKQKLGVTYKQIAEYIETGKTDENAMEIIKRKEKASLHKRMPIPVYKRTGPNLPKWNKFINNFCKTGIFC